MTEPAKAPARILLCLGPGHADWLYVPLDVGEGRAECPEDPSHPVAVYYLAYEIAAARDEDPS